MAANEHESAPAAVPADALDDLQLARRLRAVLFALLVTCVVVGAASWWLWNLQGLGTSFAGVVVVAAAFVLLGRGLTDSAVFLLLTGMLVASTATMSVGEGVHDSGMILYPTIVVIGGLLLRPRTNRILVALVVVSVAAVWWLGWMGWIAGEFRHLTDVADLLAIVGVIVVQAITVNVLARGLSRSLAAARLENAERQRAESEVRRLNAELERRVETRTAELAAANEALESFSYSVSHDLRAPLRVARNYASILADEFAGEWPQPARGFLERIRLSHERMDLLIDDLLRFSRLGRQPLDRQKVDMEATAREVVEFLAASIPGRRVDWNVSAMPAAMADPALVECVFSNLIGNALKYTGGREVARIEVGFDADGGTPSYFVRDNGVGFDMQHADRLFGVFERLHDDDEFEGNGIGLATVHRIVGRHGGRVWAQGTPGKGATFRFELPRALA